MLLNGESGYFHQVPGWDLNCAVIGAVLAELSLVSRIDTDMTSVILLDRAAKWATPPSTPSSRKSPGSRFRRSAQLLDRTARAAGGLHHRLDAWTALSAHRSILDHHEGDFWTLVSNAVGS